MVLTCIFRIFLIAAVCDHYSVLNMVESILEESEGCLSNNRKLNLLSLFDERYRRILYFR